MSVEKPSGEPQKSVGFHADTAQAFDRDEQLRFLNDNYLQGMLYQIDSGRNGERRRFSYLDSAAERLHGVKAEDARRDPELIYGQVLEEYRERLARKEAEALETRSPLDVDVMVRLPSGELRWRRFVSAPRFDPSGNVLWDGIELDITEAKRSESRLAAEKERLSVTLRSIGDGVIATDTRGVITLINRVAEELTGWSETEALGRPLSEVYTILHTLTRQPFGDPVERASRPSASEASNHSLLVSRDGRERAVTETVSPIRDAVGIVIGAVLVFRDETEKQRLIETAQRNQKLESLGVLAGGLAHDFNNLLGGIYGFLDLALGTKIEARTIDYLETAMKTINGARALTHQLLTFSRGGAPDRKAEAIAPLAEDALRFALSGSNATGSFEAGPNLRRCLIDRNQISQVLNNILINAQQAMPEGGAIRVTAVNVLLDGIDCPTLPPGAYVRISIVDEGLGIPKEILPRIFDPFFTSKRTGSGLGLAVCHSIVDRHGGCIEVESEPGKGSAFHVFLPASDAEPERTREAHSEGEGTRPANGGERILFMDDENLMRFTVEAMLKRFGYAPACAGSGNEALALFDRALKSGERFRAVILDLTIVGDRNGREIGEEIRRLDATVPIIIASGYADDPVIARPETFGFQASIRKPFRSAELGETIARCIQKEA